jgi:hypothetical protein
LQYGSNLSRVAGDGNIRAVIVRKHLIQCSLASNVLINRHFSQQRLPQQVILREACFNIVGWEGIVDVCLGPTAITGMATDSLAEKLFYCGDEWLPRRKIEAEECDVGGLQAAG